MITLLAIGIAVAATQPDGGTALRDSASPQINAALPALSCIDDLAGESVDEIAFLLGHRDANVTRAVYVRELADARRRTMRRSRMLAEFSDILQP